MITAQTVIDLPRALAVMGIEKLRPAQAEAIESVMQDKHTLAVLPTGFGKCIDGKSRVPSSRGMLRAEELMVGDGLWQNGKQATVIAVDKTKKPCLSIEMADGSFFVGSHDHRSLMCRNGQIQWAAQKDIKPGDFMCRPAAFCYQDTSSYVEIQPNKNRLRTCEKAFDAPTKVNEDLAYFMGLLVAEGYYGGGPATTTLTFGDRDLADWTVQYLVSLGLHPRLDNKAGEKAYTVAFYSVRFRRLLNSVGLVDALGAGKTVPECVFTSPVSVIKAFLSGLFDGDGHAGKNRTLEYSSASHQLIQDVQMLLACVFGVFGCIYEHPVNGVMYWRLTISGMDAQRWVEHVGFRLERKRQASLLCVGGRRNTNLDVIPSVCHLLEDMNNRWMDAGNYSLRSGTTDCHKWGVLYYGTIRSYLEGRRQPSRNAVEGLIADSIFFSFVDVGKMKDALLYRYIRVARVVDAGMRDVCDFQVTGNHTFVANGYVTHNSAVFQLPALMTRGITVVFSPLIALMSDQVAKLNKAGVPARALHSGIPLKAQERTMAEIQAGQIKFVYCAPERLNRSDFTGVLQALPVARVVVDEAHVIDEWEMDFRPSYNRIGEMLSLVKPRSVIAATATAGPRTVRVIESSLGVRFQAIHVLPPDRDNLAYYVQRGNSWAIVRSFLSDHPKVRGAIYCPTVVEVERLYREIKDRVPQRLGKYHGQMQPARREAIQEAFGNHEVDAMVCTNAFGLGVDYPDLRFVIHTGLCVSFDDYCQQVGRAGRDGKPSVCLLCVPPDAHKTPEWFLRVKNPTLNQIRAVFAYYATHKSPIIRDSASQVAKEALGDKSQEPFVNTCKAILRRAGLINTWRDPNKSRTVQFLKDPRSLNLPWRQDKRDKVLRIYDWLDRWGEKDGNSVRVRIETIVSGLPDLKEEQIAGYLLDLKKTGAIDVESDASQFCTRVLTRDFKVDEEELAEKRKNDFAKFEAMVDYASRERTTEEAREFIRKYFETEAMQLKALLEQPMEALW